MRRKKPDGTIKEYRYAAYKPKPREIGDTVEGLIDAYMSSPEWAAFSRATQLKRRGYLKPLAALNRLSVASVKRREIISLHDGMKAIGNGAAGGFLATAKALFSWAVEKDWIESPPTLRIKSVPGGHWRAWTREEADIAEKGLPEPLRRLVVLARHTGQRRADLCAMRWDQFDGKFIRLTQQKTKPGAKPVKLTIPVTQVLRAELEAWRADATAVTILQNAHGRPWRPESITQLLPYHFPKLGLDAGLNIHGFRKLAATELANAGCSPHEIASITGHRTLAMVQLYTQSVDQVRLAGAAVVRLEKYRKG